MRVVVEHAQVQTVAAGNQPALARDELRTAGGEFRALERLHQRLLWEHRDGRVSIQTILYTIY